MAISEALAATVPEDLHELRAELTVRRVDQRVEVGRLARELPNLSDDYLDVVSKLDLEGVSIGYFHSFVSPSTISDASSNQSSEQDASWPENRYLACWHEGDPVFVSTDAGDIVTTVNHSTGIEYPIARSFSELLILASNLVAARVLGTGAAAAIESIDRILSGESELKAVWRDHLRATGLV